MKIASKGFILFSLVIIMSLSIIAAQTVVSGKAYNSDFSSKLNGADITVTCESGASQSTKSLPTGAYTVVFPVDECALGDSVTATLTGGYTGSNSGTLATWSVVPSNITKFAIINLNGVAVITPPNNGGGGGGGGSSCTYNQNYDWKCSEWSACTNGIQARSCNAQNNCGNTFGRPALTQTCGETNSTNSSSILPPETTEQNPGFFGGITGAVTGALGTVGTTIVIVFLIAVFGSAVAVRMVRKNKKLK